MNKPEGMLERTYQMWVDRFSEEGCEVTKIERSKQNYLITYIYKGGEFVVRNSSWQYGDLRPHLCKEGVSHKTKEWYKDQVNKYGIFLHITSKGKGLFDIFLSYNGHLHVICSTTITSGSWVRKLRKHSESIDKLRERVENLPKRRKGKSKKVLREFKHKETLRLANKFPKEGYWLYCFKEDGVVKYVGKTNNPYKRIYSVCKSHHKCREYGDKLYMAEFSSEADRNVMELYLINLWKPERNSSSYNSGKASDELTYKLPIPTFQRWNSKEENDQYLESITLDSPAHLLNNLLS